MAFSALLTPLLFQSTEASSDGPAGSAFVTPTHTSATPTHPYPHSTTPKAHLSSPKPLATSALGSFFGSSPQSLADYSSDPSYRRIPPPPSFKSNHAIYENVLHEGAVKKYDVYRSPTEIDKETGKKKEGDFEVVVADLEFGDKVRRGMRALRREGLTWRSGGLG